MAAILRTAKLPQYIDNYPPGDTETSGHAVHFMSDINRALYDIYGARGARAILNRIGRGRAKNAIEENATFANAVKTAIHFLPGRMKVKLVLERVSKEFSQQMNTSVRIYEEGNAFFWQDSNCAGCIGWTSETPVCFTTTGFIQGVLAWGLGGEDFKVQEIACRAKGDEACLYQITTDE
jgi:predicted hydrocarbon binding protein